MGRTTSQHVVQEAAIVWTPHQYSGIRFRGDDDVQRFTQSSRVGSVDNLQECQRYMKML